MKRIILRAAAVVAMVCTVAACSIQQQVKPVALAERGDGKICVVEDKSVRAGFLPTMQAAMEAKGLQVTLVPSIAEGRACPLYATYMGNWRWDLAWYMAYAKITVYEGMTEKGSAVYDSLAGGGRLDKFIDAEPKIRELVDQLFP
jgi:hypothetical protein